MKKRLEFDKRCNSCEGTGLYVGMAERDGFAVVCHTCSGTGSVHVVIEYDDDTTKQPAHAGVSRVLRVNPGIVAAPGVVPGGVSLAEWQADPTSVNQPGAEMRKHTCPAWWYQLADYTRKPDWPECGDALGRSFSDCSSFPTKAACWRKWDAEAAP